MATRAVRVSSSITRDSALGTKVVATPTFQPVFGGIGRGRRIKGSESQCNWYMHRVSRSPHVMRMKRSGWVTGSPHENQRIRRWAAAARFSMVRRAKMG
jgi:hypothetical protein